MEDHEFLIMDRFPLLSMSEDLKRWTGFLSTGLGKTVRISLVVPAFPAIADIRLDEDDLGEDAKAFWNPLFEQQINQAGSDTLLEFLEGLEAQVLGSGKATDLTNDDDNDKTEEDNSELCSVIIKEVEDIGVNNVVSVSPDFKEVVFKALDNSEREHRLKLAVADGYPRVQPTVIAELPFPKDSLEWPTRVTEIYQKFNSLVEKCCGFWDDMDELDNSVKIVDPMQPNKSHFHRRILLENSVIMHLIFNPLAPRAFPQISFAGPDKYVETFNAAIDQECHMWDDTVKVIQNLRSILCCNFVLKESEDADNLEEQAPCTVCYVYNFEDEIPEITCVCGAGYHPKCLQDLFISDISKTAFRRFVECPNCQMDIRVPARFTNAANW